jgi:hypothetical protein
MVLTKQQKIEFVIAAKPMMDYLAKNHHPHVLVITESTNAEILESSAKILNKNHP